MRSICPKLVLVGSVLAAACGGRPQYEFDAGAGAGGVGAAGRVNSADSSVGNGGNVDIDQSDAGITLDADRAYDGSNVPTATCGDSQLGATAGEECDDGNLLPGDGCSAACTLEVGWICPTPGEPCVKTQKCGDGKVSGEEQCDDANQESEDGCSQGCMVERGWACPTPGARCQPAACGDGIPVGSESCDDGNSKGGDGCSTTCQVEHGYFCPTAGAACQPTVCGNNVREGDEGCDHGDKQPWDGCSPNCELEPTCTAGECHSVCGDGMMLSGDNEECDDGNQNDSDGCSKDCKKEKGWDCKVAPEAPPSQLVLPVVYRDFVALPVKNPGDAGVDGGGLEAGPDGGLRPRHPNFEDDIRAGLSEGLVTKQLGSNSKPVYAGICDNESSPAAKCPNGRQLTTQADFDEWYTDTPASIRADSTLTLSLATTGTQYVFDAGSRFLPFGAPGPLENVGWVAQGSEQFYRDTGNFGFTTELHYWFQLNGGEHLEFSGDDDVWVFLKNDLMIDLGGRHAKLKGTIDLTDEEIAARGLEKGRIYEIAFFHAERHTSESNFKLTLNNFVRSTTSCKPECGDGIVVRGEVCDDGALNGTYGHCNTTCSGRGPHCGDGQRQADEGEECDDGVNLSTYGINGVPRCAPGCKLSPYCGDGKTDSLFGEQCDSPEGSSGCHPNCTFRAHCGDHIVQPADGETCDDGNTISGDGCSSFCTREAIPM